jgi:hypothetical protein
VKESLPVRFVGNVDGWVKFHGRVCMVGANSLTGGRPFSPVLVFLRSLYFSAVQILGRVPWPREAWP